MTKREQGMCGRWAAAGLCALLVGLAGCGGVPVGTRAAVALGAEPTLVSATVVPTATLVSSPTAIVVLPSATPAPSPKPTPTEPTAAATVTPTPTDGGFTTRG